MALEVDTKEEGGCQTWEKPQDQQMVEKPYFRSHEKGKSVLVGVLMHLCLPMKVRFAKGGYKGKEGLNKSTSASQVDPSTAHRPSDFGKGEGKSKGRGLSS